MNTRPGAASNRAMLTVHKLHPFHDLLQGNQDASAAGDNGYTEVIVVIDRGEIVGVHTPPGGELDFCSDEDWVLAAIRDGYARGVSAGMLYDKAIEQANLAPKGWTHWSDLRFGDVASSGNPDGGVLVLGEPGMFNGHLPRTNANAMWIREGSSNVFTYKPDSLPPLPFVRIEARGLTSEQLRHVAAAVATGENGVAWIVANLPSEDAQ